MTSIWSISFYFCKDSF